MMNLGAKIIWLRTENMRQVIAGGTLTKINTESYCVNNQHKAQDQINKAYCLPDTPESRQVFQAFIDEEARHIAIDKTNIANWYKLRNELINSGML